jgi:hypothetical protein
MTDEPRDERRSSHPALPVWGEGHLLCALAIVATTTAWLWALPLRSSLWLDETGTVWLIRGGLFDSLSRSFRFQGGSPLYYIVEWTTAQILGKSELALRAPSFVAMVVAAWLLYRLGCKLFDPGAGALAAVVFVAMPSMAFAAGDARPYALALAALIGSMLALARWLDTGATRDAVLYALLFAATVYLHYLVALPLVAQLIYLLWKSRRSAIGTRQLITTLAAIGFLCFPAILLLLRVTADRTILSNPHTLTGREWLAGLVPVAICTVAGASLAIAIILFPPRGIWRILRNPAVLLLLGWLGLTFLTLVGISVLSTTNVMVPRYFVSLVPAAALLFAVICRTVSAVWPQLAVVAVITLVSLAGFARVTHTDEDWRSAAATERALVQDEHTPVLLFSGFIEAKQIDWLTDPEKSSYLNAPASAYPLRGDVIPLPFRLEGDPTAYLEELVDERLLLTDRFILVTRGTDEPFNGWFSERLAPHGFTSVLHANYGQQIQVYEFLRN